MSVLWKFDPNARDGLLSDCGAYLLEPNGEAPQFVEDAELGRPVLEFKGGGWLQIPRSRLGILDIHGAGAQVTVEARVKIMAPALYQAIAGVWDETRGKRQYCLFYNLTSRYESKGNLHGHISHVGGPTPGHEFCVTYATGASRLPLNRWLTLAMQYDGEDVRVFIDGQLDQNPRADPFRPGKCLNPYPYPGSIFDGGPEGAPFTVGGVHRSGEMGNWFIGRLAGLRVERRG